MGRRSHEDGRLHRGEELRGRRLLNVLRGYDRIRSGEVVIDKVTGPLHARTFRAIALIVGLSGASVTRRAEAGDVDTAKGEAVGSALQALAQVEPELNVRMPDAEERRAARRKRQQA